jgi:Insertion element 4 transposase N-terminal/Transposase DDE domain
VAAEPARSLVVAHNGVVAAGGRLTDWISLGVLASSVPRDAVDEAVAAAGKGAKRSDGKLPPHVMVYFAMALALFAEEDYEEVAARLTETLASWGCWDQSWATPTSGGITQARKRLGPEPLELLFGKVAVPVAGELTRGAFLRDWRLMAIDGFELDVPDTPANAAAFGYPAGTREHPAFPKVRVVTIGECGSHAKVAAQMGPVGGKGTCEQALARRMFGRLEAGWLLIADRGFYNWPDWQAAAATGAALLWRVKADLRLPVLELLPDGSYLSLVARPTLHDKARNKLIAAARAGERLDPAQARRVRVIEYEIPDRDGDGSGELIALLTTITDPAAASAQELAEAYCQRWEEETGHDQLKTCLRGPGAVLRSKSPDMIRQEIYGYLLTHYAISALICRAATEAGIDPDRVKFLRTVRIIRRRAADPAFPP